MQTVITNGLAPLQHRMTWALIVRLLVGICLVSLGFVGAIDAFVTIAGLVSVAAADLSHLLSLKNYFLGYVMLIFGVGGMYFARGDLVMSLDLLLYVSVFVAGYSLASRLAPAGRPGTSIPSRAETSLADWLLWLVLAGWLFFLVAQIAAYGLGGFYSGEALADRISRYGHADFVNGLMSIFEQGLSTVTLATAAYYIDLCVRRNVQPNYWRLGLLFLVMPIFLLRRADNAIGTLFLLAIQPVAARMVGLRYSVRAAAPLIAGSLLLSLASSVVIGSLRDVAVSPPTPSPIDTDVSPTPSPIDTDVSPTPASPVPTGTSRPVTPAASPTTAPSIPTLLRTLVTFERTDRMLRSELSPIVAYRDIREHPSDFGYQMGSTILPPLALKIAPRSWLPDKPISSSAFYMTRRDPSSLAAGYLLPVTIFGDALLNFGYAGALALVALLGLLAGRLDRAMQMSSVGELPMFLIIYYNFYGLLRNDLANSLAVILLTCGVFLFLRHYHLLVSLVPRIRNSIGA